MNVVHVSRTALAGTINELNKCLNKYQKINSRWVALKTDYKDGRVFPKDLLYNEDGLKVIEQADIIHVHNDPFADMDKLFQGKKKIVQFHSCPIRETYNELCSLTKHCYTITQPMQLKEYGYCLPSLPNVIDTEEYRPIEKDNAKPVIVFAPTNKENKNVIGSKARDEVVAILEKFKDVATLDIFNNLHYEENLQHKQKADIIIDDVVGHTFHRTSLEGASFGCAVLTSYATKGFVYTTLDNLENNLLSLIKDKQLLDRAKKASRDWVTQYWHPLDMTNKYMIAYEKVLKD